MAEIFDDTYDDEPVLYCKRCYSLSIRHEDAIGMDCCTECGCSDIAEASFDEWENLYSNRYGHKFVEKNTDPKKSYIFNLPIRDLKSIMYKEDNWKNVIKSIYPGFPEGLGREDSIIMFFDKLAKDNNMDSLRMYLYKHRKK